MLGYTSRTHDGDVLAAIARSLEVTRKPSWIAIASVSLVWFWSGKVRQKLAHMERGFGALWNFGGLTHRYGSEA